MSKIPYEVSNKIGETIGLPAEFCGMSLEALTKFNGLGFLTADNDFGAVTSSDEETAEADAESLAVKPTMVYHVLKHIAFRSLQFDKVGEFIRFTDVIEGKPSLGIAGVPCSEKTVKRILLGLSSPRSQWLFRLILPTHHAQTAIYGLNLPFVLMAIEGAWNEAIENFAKDKKERYDFYGDEPEISATTGSILADRGKMLLHHCVDYAKIFEPTFNFLLKQTSTIMSLKAFLRELAATLPNQKKGAAAIQQFLFATNHKEVKRALKEKRKNLSDN